MLLLCPLFIMGPVPLHRASLNMNQTVTASSQTTCLALPVASGIVAIVTPVCQ